MSRKAKALTAAVPIRKGTAMLAPSLPFRSAAALACGACLALVASRPALATNDCANGQALFRTVINGVTCSNAACHGPNPAQNVNFIQNGANNPQHIAATISINPPMFPLQGRLSASDLSDLATWIADAPNCPANTPPAALTLPGPYQFAPQSVGSASAPHTFTVGNAGANPITIMSVTTSNGVEFAITSNGCAGAIAPRASCDLAVAFSPSASGTRSSTITVASNAAGSPQSFALTGDGCAGSSPSVIEYIDTQDFPNAPGGHFFYSDSACEIALVDTGVAGRFVRTGESFKTGGPKALCRFYGNPVWGPNSHFFTIDDNECALVKSLQFTPPPPNVQQWNYEGLAFSETPPVGAGADRSCPAGTIPVYRAYNNAIRNGVKNAWDSNHRYWTDKAALDAFAAANGWASEGLVFCAQP
jgi:mono/diheme cytochrome c family protein